MDAQKQLSQLDPKLKEAYERVMGNSQSAGQTPIGTIPATPPIQSAPNSMHPASSPQEAVAAEKVTITDTHPSANLYTPPPASHPVSPNQMGTGPTTTVYAGTPAPHTPTGTIHIGYGAHSGPKMNIEKKKLNIPPALYIVGCLIFFLLYTVFWVKVFNITLPFLP